MRWLWLTLYVLLVPSGAASGVLLAFSTKLGAKNVEEACGALVLGLGSCIEPQPPTWALAFGAAGGAIAAVAVVQVLKHLPN